MEIQARYYAKLKDGKLIYVCSHHVTKIATRPNDSRRLQPRPGVMFIGSLSEYTSKKCGECRK